MTIQENISLKPFNTFGIEAKARYFAAFDSLSALEESLDLRPPTSDLRPPTSDLRPPTSDFRPPTSDLRLPTSDSQLILGGGSNILLTKDFDGLVLKNEIKGVKIVNEDADHIYIQAGAGENWHQFVLYCVKNNYAGIENLSLIPGNVGASPMQNIGAYGVEIRDVFHELEAFHKKEKKIYKFSLQDCAFGYRESVFKNKFRDQFVIINVTYRLNKKPAFHTSYGAIQQELEKMGVKDLSIQAISRAVINIRSSKLPDPRVTGNAGSFFKNPIIPNEQFHAIKKNFPNIIAFPSGTGHTKLAAGWLIEQCGWKGYRKGDAGCYPKQALVLVNYGRASGREIFELSEEIIQSVEKTFGVILEREVNIISGKHSTGKYSTERRSSFS